MKSRISHPQKMNQKNEEILQKLDSKLDSKPKKSKNEFVLKQKNPVNTGL